MYWRISILQDIYLEYVENVIKICLQTKHKAESAQRNKEKPTITTKPGPSTNVGGA